MKYDTKAIRRAAEVVDRNPCYACAAIAFTTPGPAGLSIENNHNWQSLKNPIMALFLEWFKPEHLKFTQLWWGSSFDPKNQECRVFALLLLELIAKDLNKQKGAK